MQTPSIEKTSYLYLILLDLDLLIKPMSSSHVLVGNNQVTSINVLHHAT